MLNWLHHVLCLGVLNIPNSLTVSLSLLGHNQTVSVGLCTSKFVVEDFFVKIIYFVR